MKTLANAAHANEIKARLNQLTEADQPKWGSMDVDGMLCHCRDVFRHALGERPSGSVKLPLPSFLVKWVVLDAPMAWPKGLKTPPDMEQGGGGTQTAGFAVDLDLMKASLDEFLTHAGPWSPNPALGPFTQANWMRFGWLHTDHHLRQFGR